jgi:acyl carrier protein
MDEMGPREIVLQIVRAHVSAGRIGDDDPLGADGLGLDSIAIAEVLLECEVRLGAPVSELLEARGPLTVARIAEHLEAAAAR